MKLHMHEHVYSVHSLCSCSGNIVLSKWKGVKDSLSLSKAPIYWVLSRNLLQSSDHSDFKASPQNSDGVTFGVRQYLIRIHSNLK